MLGYLAGARPAVHAFTLPTEARVAAPAADVAHRATTSGNNDAGADPARYAAVRVEGFADVGMPEMFELLQAASAEQKDAWAKQLLALPLSPQKRVAASAF